MSKLELRAKQGGFRHYLDGISVHDGDVFGLAMPDGTWGLARYEQPELAPPALSVKVAEGEWQALREGADPELRWPQLAPLPPARGTRMTCAKRVDGVACGAPVWGLHERYGLVCAEHFERE